MNIKGLIALVLLLCLGCGGPKVKRIDVATEGKDDLGTSSLDFQSMSQLMARSIIKVPAIKYADIIPSIAFLEMENRSNEYIDTEGIMEKIRFLLLKHGEGKITFLDRKHIESIREERKQKRAGEFSGEKKGKIIGVTYFLTGSVTSIDKATVRDMSQYSRYSFRLTDGETNVIIWEDEYEFKKKVKRGIWD